MYYLLWISNIFLHQHACHHGSWGACDCICTIYTMSTTSLPLPTLRIITYLRSQLVTLTLNISNLSLNPLSITTTKVSFPPSPSSHLSFFNSQPLRQSSKAILHTHISFPINSNLPSTAITASVFSCLSKTGPTSL